MSNQQWKEEFLEDALGLKRIGITKLFKNRALLIISPSLTSNWFGISPKQKEILDNALKRGIKCYILIRLCNEKAFLLTEYVDIKLMLDRATPSSNHYHLSLKRCNNNFYYIKNNSNVGAIELNLIFDEEIKRRLKK